MANGRVKITYNDYGAESSNVSLRMPTLTAANLDAAILAASSIYDAIAGANGICKGIRIKSELGNQYPILPNTTQAADEDAQREMKWKVNMLDATAMKSPHFTLPCADLTYLDPNNRGYADMSNADVAAFVTAIETETLSPDGNAWTVQSIQFVGRNN